MQVLLIQSQFHIIYTILCLHLEVHLNEYLTIDKALQLHYYAHSAQMTV